MTIVLATLTWHKESEKFFEAGIDRGVLQVSNSDPVSWSGIISLKENGGDQDVTPIYQNGVRQYNYLLLREFSANLSAYSYPDLFAQCEGLYADAVSPGFYIDQQETKTFNLSYRTGVGSGTVTVGEHYKLHFVYNCTVKASDRDYTTIGSSVTPMTYSWDISTVPDDTISSTNPSAHFIVDSRKAIPAKLKALEELLYGTSSKAPKFPTPLDISTILKA